MKQKVTLTIQRDNEEDVLLDFHSLEQIDSLLGVIVEMREDLEERMNNERERRRMKKIRSMERKKSRECSSSNHDIEDVERCRERFIEMYNSMSPEDKKSFRPLFELTEAIYHKIIKGEE